MDFILSQIFVILAYILLGTTFWLKNRTIILFINLMSLVCSLLSYFYLNAWTGMLVVCVAMIRNIGFVLVEKYCFHNKKYIIERCVLCIVILMSVIAGVFTYAGFFSLFSVFASVVYTIAVWQHNIKIYKILGIISSLFGIVYYLFIGSIFGILLESCVLIVAIVSVIMLFVKNKNSGEVYGIG